jgi:hypothetical protein
VDFKHGCVSSALAAARAATVSMEAVNVGLSVQFRLNRSSRCERGGKDGIQLQKGPTPDNVPPSVQTIWDRWTKKDVYVAAGGPYMNSSRTLGAPFMRFHRMSGHSSEARTALPYPHDQCPLRLH